MQYPTEVKNHNYGRGPNGFIFVSCDRELYKITFKDLQPMNRKYFL